MLIHSLSERANRAILEKHFVCLNFSDDSDCSNEGILTETWVYETRRLNRLCVYTVDKEQWNAIRSANLHRIVLVDTAYAAL